MPLTFYMTNDQKPLVIIHDEQLTHEEVKGMFSARGYQQPEIYLENEREYNEELDRHGIPKNNRIIIFANKRAGQSFPDPTMAQILETLESNGIQIDPEIETKLESLFNFLLNLQGTAEEVVKATNEEAAKRAAEAGLQPPEKMTLEDFYAESFPDGDRISPLIPGLKEFLAIPRSNAVTPLRAAIPADRPHAFKATPRRASGFNALAIALGAKIIHGDLDSQQNQPLFQALLKEFEIKNTPDRKLSWNALKGVLQKFNAQQDIETLLAPVLFQLTYKFLLRKELKLLNSKIAAAIANVSVSLSATDPENSAKLQNLSPIGDQTATQFSQVDRKPRILVWISMGFEGGNYLLSSLNLREGAEWLTKLSYTDDIDTEVLLSLWKDIENKILVEKFPVYDRYLGEAGIKTMMSELFSDADTQNVEITKSGEDWLVKLDPSLSCLINKDAKRLNKDIDKNFKWPEANQSNSYPSHTAVPKSTLHSATSLTTTEKRAAAQETTPLRFEPQVPSAPPLDTPSFPIFAPYNPPIILANCPRRPKPHYYTSTEIASIAISSIMAPENVALSPETSAPSLNIALYLELSKVCVAYCNDKLFFQNASHNLATNIAAFLEKIIHTYHREKFDYPDHFLAIVLVFVLTKLNRSNQDAKFTSCIEDFLWAYRPSLQRIRSSAMTSKRLLEILNKHNIDFSDPKCDIHAIYNLIRTDYAEQFQATLEPSDPSHEDGPMRLQ